MKILLMLLSITVWVERVNGGTIAWFYALDEDKRAFESSVGPPLRSVNLGTRVVHEYQLGPHKLVAARMGSGCVNTAVTAASVLAVYPAGRVISTGPAGVIGEDVALNEWLRVERVVPWQKGRMEEGGRILPGEALETSFQSENWPAGPWNELKAAKLASGEAFIASSDARSQVRAATDAPLVEMNAFGLLAALEGRKVDCLILRVVSDRADERASEDFAEFVKTYDGSGGQMVAELIKTLPVGKDEPAAHEALRELLEE